jgi:hypothetical protein
MEEKVDMDNERPSYYYYIHFVHYRHFCIDVQQLLFCLRKIRATYRESSRGQTLRRAAMPVAIHTVALIADQ